MNAQEKRRHRRRGELQDEYKKAIAEVHRLQRLIERNERRIANQSFGPEAAESMPCDSSPIEPEDPGCAMAQLRALAMGIEFLLDDIGIRARFSATPRSVSLTVLALCYRYDRGQEVPRWSSREWAAGGYTTVAKLEEWASELAKMLRSPDEREPRPFIEIQRPAA